MAVVFFAMAQIKSWTVSDELWRKIQGLVPPSPTRPADKVFKRKSGARTSPCLTDALSKPSFTCSEPGYSGKPYPRSMEAPVRCTPDSNIRRAGVFLRIWRAGLAEYDGMEGIAWEW